MGEGEEHTGNGRVELAIPRCLLRGDRLGSPFGKGGEGDFQILDSAEYLVVLLQGSFIYVETNVIVHTPACGWKEVVGPGKAILRPQAS